MYLIVYKSWHVLVSIKITISSRIGSVYSYYTIASIDQLYAYSYQPRIPFTAKNGWEIYDPIKEYERMGIDSKTNMWRITPINQDYKVKLL